VSQLYECQNEALRRKKSSPAALHRGANFIAHGGLAGWTANRRAHETIHLHRTALSDAGDGGPFGIAFCAGGAIDLRSWLAIDQPALTNLAHLLTLIALVFASAQAFNSVLPESGLLHWMFSFFFLWTLWTNQFSSFDPRRLLRSIMVLFGTAFVLKHLLAAGLYAPEGGLLRRLVSTVLQGIAIDVPAFAPVTGYISFFALVLYVVALLLIAPAPAPPPASEVNQLAVREDALTE